jgi:hypothetical protein
MTKRRAISKKTRFDIFKRDLFTCQYCGNHPPDAILHIDHIVAVANGGTNEPDNFITACQTCNLGKGARPLTSAPQNLKDKSKEIAERELQLNGYYQILQKRRDRIEEEIWSIVDIFTLNQERSIRRDYFASIKRFIERLGYFEVIEAMEIATAKYPYSSSKKFKYFCGVCWTKIGRAQNGQS